MSREKNEKLLDELICRTINSGRPEFDAEKWKQKHPKEFQMLRSMSKQDSHTRRPSIWWIVRYSPITKLAAAAAIIVVIGLLAVRIHRRPVEQNGQKTVESPIQMMTAISLERAFRRGGLEAVEEQSRKAFRPLELRPASLSFEHIIAEFNGNNKNSEGTRL